MNKENRKKQKAATKSIRERLATNLIKDLTANVSELAKSDTKSLKKVINKGAKQLAKKLMNKISISEAVLAQAMSTSVQNEATIEPKQTKKPKKVSSKE